MGRSRSESAGGGLAGNHVKVDLCAHIRRQDPVAIQRIGLQPVQGGCSTEVSLVGSLE